jgi:hypothetical protein
MDHFGSIGPLACMISEADLNFINVNSQMRRGKESIDALAAAIRFRKPVADL